MGSFTLRNGELEFTVEFVTSRVRVSPLDSALAPDGEPNWAHVEIDFDGPEVFAPIAAEPGAWIMADGRWNDAGRWNDTAKWSDAA